MKTCEKLQRILNAFVEGRLPKDDTMLERLMRWMMINFENSPEVGMVKLIEEVLAQADPDTHTVAFFLRMLGIIPQQAQIQLDDTIWRLYDKVFNTALWDITAIRCAWLIGMTNHMKNNSVGDNIITLKSGYLTKILDCMTDGSLYVSSAAVELVSILQTWCLTSVGSEDNTVQHNQFRETFMPIFRKILSEKKASEDAKYAVFVVVQKTISKNTESLEKLWVNHGLFDRICSVLSRDNGQVTDAMRQLIMQILDVCRSNKCLQTPDDVRRLEMIVGCQLTLGDIQTAMIISQWLLLWYEDQVKNEPILWSTFFLPTTVICNEIAENPQSLLPQNEHDEDLEIIVKQCLEAKKNRFGSLMLRQLDLIRNYHEHKSIPLDRLCNLKKAYGIVNDFTSPLTATAKSDRVKHGIMDTFTYIFTTCPSHRTRPLMIDFCTACVGQLVQPKSCLMVQKSLQCCLTALVYLTNNLGAHAEESSTGGIKSDPSVNDESPGDFVQECTQLWIDIAAIVRRLLCDPSWEIVDSALEFLTDVLYQLKDVPWIYPAFIGPNLGPFEKCILKNIDNSESYLRASALKCTTAMANVPEIWQNIVHKHSQNGLLEKMMDIAKKDPEAFARRAAVTSLAAMYTGHKDMSAAILDTMFCCSYDLDWEVRMQVLVFWSSYLDSYDSVSDQGIPEYAQNLICENIKSGAGDCKEEDDLLDSMCGNGCLQGLLDAARDCDKSVQEKACLLLMKIRNKTLEEPLLKRAKISETNYQNNLKEVNSTQDVCDANNTHKVKASLKSKQQLLNEFRGTDLESLLELSKLSTDQYDLNPDSLLDDILISVSTHHCRGDVGDREDNVIDCY